jgi:pimeloyl-ACP methyl ester carboxylesterase
MSHKISRREVGDGPLLILLHGYGGSVMHWDGVVENLKKSYCVVIPNISHLFLSQDKIFFSVQVEVLAKYIRENYTERKVHVAGTSYGGALAWALSIQHPDLIEKMILINPMVLHPGRQFLPPEIRYFCVLPWNEKSIFAVLSTPIGRALVRRLGEAFRDQRNVSKARSETLKGKKLAFVAHLIHRFTWILRSEDWDYWRDKMQKNTKPVASLMIYDHEDYLFSRESYQQLAVQLGCQMVREISGAGHLAIKSRPETVAQLMAQFLESNSKAA